MVEKILNNTTPYGKIRASHEGSLYSSTLIEQINDSLQRPTLRGHAIPPLIQVVYFFTVLYFSYRSKAKFP